MSERTQRHRLDGLEPDNLMAFLALLGTLRALDCAKPHWKVRASWSVDAPPLRPVLHLAQAASQAQVCTAVAEGARTLFAAVDLHERKDLKLAGSDARRELCRASSLANVSGPARFAADLLTAMGSDCARTAEEQASVSPLCFPSVAQVSFVKSVRDIIAAEAPTERVGSSRNLGTANDAISRALFADWLRLDRPPGLRWDHEEGRQHAHQWAAPTTEQPTTEHGANRLALIGLSYVAVLPSTDTAVARTPVIGARPIDDAFAIRWPIWRHAMSPTAIRSLLAYRGHDDKETHRRLGIVTLYSASRVGLGKFIAFTRATQLPTEV